MSNIVNATTKVTGVTIELNETAAIALVGALGLSPCANADLSRVYDELSDLFGIDGPTARGRTANAGTYSVNVPDLEVGEINTREIRNHLRKYVAEKLFVAKERVEVTFT